jgi:hypothetical protein
MRAAVNKLSDQQLDTPYRPGGWTVRQVLHHVPDSHLNAYIRFKLALTESEPMIKPYDEKQWAELPDVRLTPTEVSCRSWKTCMHVGHCCCALLSPLHSPGHFAIPTSGF